MLGWAVGSLGVTLVVPSFFWLDGSERDLTINSVAQVRQGFWVTASRVYFNAEQLWTNVRVRRLTPEQLLSWALKTEKPTTFSLVLFWPTTTTNKKNLNENCVRTLSGLAAWAHGRRYRCLLTGGHTIYCQPASSISTLYVREWTCPRHGNHSPIFCA